MQSWRFCLDSAAASSFYAMGQTKTTKKKSAPKINLADIFSNVRSTLERN